jgi:hypothetical protein
MQLFVICNYVLSFLQLLAILLNLLLRVRATRGYAIPATRPPFALENSLTDTENKTQKKKKKKKRFVLARAVPGNCPDGKTDTENKTPKQQNETKQKGPCWPRQCPETARTIHHQ